MPFHTTVYYLPIQRGVIIRRNPGVNQVRFEPNSKHTKEGEESGRGVERNQIYQPHCCASLLQGGNLRYWFRALFAPLFYFLR